METSRRSNRRRREKGDGRDDDGRAITSHQKPKSRKPPAHQCPTTISSEIINDNQCLHQGLRFNPLCAINRNYTIGQLETRVSFYFFKKIILNKRKTINHNIVLLPINHSAGLLNRLLSINAYK